ncbi:protein kinase domain-containing protein [Streptomyces canus]|uniref:serine/threonine-protein kinase n=1 Tax=Streptomyces canus TaxID=58343 RepID=UPI003CE77D53
MAGETPDQGQGQGRIINSRYRLLRTLGAGGMGRVWLAHDEELACEVALKEIALSEVPRDATEHEQRVARARSEARHAARLRGHPHVATVHDVVVHDGLPWIVMEYVPDAVDLQAVVRRSGPLPPVQVARVGLAVLDALTAGHRIGILHRDVKPANVLVSRDASGDSYARVLLTDYGIALQPESREPRLTATAGILGTPGYLAPERARGEPPTPAADLFSLGATLYAAVEGRGPFDRHGEYATLTALLGEDPTPPARAGELAPVLQGLLVKDPVRRSSPEAVARGLERVLRSAEGARPSGTPGPGTAAVAGDPGAPPGAFGPPPQGYGAAVAGAGAAAAGPAPWSAAGDAAPPVAGSIPGHGSSPGSGATPGQGIPAGSGAPPGHVGSGGSGAPPGNGTPGGSGGPSGAPPGHVSSGQPPGQGTPGGAGAPPGHGVPGGHGAFPGYSSPAPSGGAGLSGAPHTPGTPPVPYAPGTPQTPQTPTGGSPPTPGAPTAPGTPPAPVDQHTPGAPPAPAAPYGPWQPPVPPRPSAPGNPYAQAAGGFPAQGASAGPSSQASGGPYATGGANGTPYAGAPLPYAAGAGTYGDNAGRHGGGPTPPFFAAAGPSGGPPPPASRKRASVIALVVAAVLVVAAGAWAAVSLVGRGDDDTPAAKKSSSPSAPTPSSSPTGPVYPYGEAVGLTRPLETGDCVKAVWSGEPFASAPNLGVVDCTEDWPDGQVVAVDTATDFADARDRGAQRCAAQSRAVVAALPDAGGYAVVPTREGFTAADSGTACLVLGRHVAIGGEVGRFRDAGTDLWVGQMSVGDCWIYEDLDDGYKAPLTDCAKPHTDQVIGTVQAADKMSYKNGVDNASKLCANKFESAWAPGSERVVVGWMTDEEDWNAGFTKIVCTVSRVDNGKTTGKIPAPGAV